MNDSTQSVYTDIVCFTIFNLALDNYKRFMNLIDIPKTHETSVAILILQVLSVWI